MQYQRLFTRPWPLRSDTQDFSDRSRRLRLARRGPGSLADVYRNGFQKWLRAPKGVEPRYRRRDKPGKLAAFQTQLIQALEADAHRPKRERRTGLALKAQITAQGYTGGYTRPAASVEDPGGWLRVDLRQVWSP